MVGKPKPSPDVGLLNTVSPTYDILFHTRIIQGFWTEIYIEASPREKKTHRLLHLDRNNHSTDGLTWEASSAFFQYERPIRFGLSTRRGDTTRVDGGIACSGDICVCVYACQPFVSECFCLISTFLKTFWKMSQYLA